MLVHERVEKIFDRWYAKVKARNATIASGGAPMSAFNMIAAAVLTGAECLLMSNTIAFHEQDDQLDAFEAPADESFDDKA